MAKSDRKQSVPSEIAIKPAAKPERPVRADFPGPRGAEARLRVALDRSGYAELVVHAKESLDREVCGVLVGQIGEDDAGVFVHVQAVIRGNAATQSATAVTFTQATWDSIHQTLEQDYPDHRIVGWYHTHPGFGVEFSEMDLFIQRNFFSAPTQIALVTDPLGGDVAIVCNAPQGIEYLPRFWVDGREQLTKVPSGEVVAGSDAKAMTAPSGDLAFQIRSLESRVSQLIQAHDDQRASTHRMMLFLGFVAALAMIGSAAYFIFQQYASRFEPPRGLSFAPVPVKIGDKTALLGVGVVEWTIPPEMDAMIVQAAKLQQEAAAAEKQAAAQGASLPETEKGSSSTPPATSPSNGKQP